MYKKFSLECDIPVYEPLCRRLLDDGEGDQSEFMTNQQLVIAPVRHHRARPFILGATPP
jgi:hypothetical protein